VASVANSQVAVIGGGIVGCSVLYHLAQAGFEAVLLERSELTAGSTWHAAGNLFSLTSPSNVQRLQKYTIELYGKLQAGNEYPIGYHPTGGLVLASSEEECDTLKIAVGQARRNGIAAEFLSFAEARRLAPILNTAGLHAVLFEPLKGHVDPASITQALAAAARKLGARVQRQTPVTGTHKTRSGEWEVETPGGTFRAEYVVNAAGLWAREVAALAGITLPLQPVQHHYMVTETIPEIAALHHELPTISDSEAAFYSRQEGKGLLLGAYERTCHYWAVEGTPLNFGHELLPDDLSRISENLHHAILRLPCLASAGIKRVVNGPMIFSPDLGPLVGPHPELKNYFCACGVMTGFNQGGGVGRILAEWIVDGEPSLDVSCWDVARFYPWANKNFTLERTRYFYENRDARVYPYQEYDAGRPVRGFPTYTFHKENRAVFGMSAGWEYPLWYARPGEDAIDRPSYRRGNWFNAVGEECRAVRDSVGLFDISTFAKYEFAGPAAESWLRQLLAGRIPTRLGQTALVPMVSEKGRLIGDFTVTRLGEQQFLVIGAGSMETMHIRHFTAMLPKHGVVLTNHSAEWTGTMIAGPEARHLLSRLTNDDVSNEAMPFLSGKRLSVDGISDVKAVRISFTGELGYELYCLASDGPKLLIEMLKAGSDFDLRLAGSRALMSLRLEKAYPSWGSELTSDYTPYEPGLDRFLDLSRDFVGKTAIEKLAEVPPTERLVTLVVDTDDMDCFGGEAVFRDGRYIGYVSSGGYGHTIGESLALAYLDPRAVEERAVVEVEMIGTQRKATISLAARFDRQGKRQRV
jgi:dimethylglycine dehydrogenase